MSRFLLAKSRKFQGFRDEDNAAFKPFMFCQLADTQFGFFNDDKEWSQETDLSRRAVKHLNAMKPSFAIVCGDLTNSLVEIYPKADASIRTRQVADFKKVFAELDDEIPLVCVCGNHDIGNTPDKTTTERWTNDFGDDYFSFVCHGVLNIVLNSSLIADPRNVLAEYDAHLAWFENELSRARARNVKHILVFAHHPFFLLRGDEPDLGDEFGVTEFVDVGTGRLEKASACQSNVCMTNSAERLVAKRIFSRST
jgi:hypothetical protein